MATVNLAFWCYCMFLQLLQLVDCVAIIELEFYDRGILVPSFVGVGYSIWQQRAVQVADLQLLTMQFHACVGVSVANKFSTPQCIECTVAVRLMEMFDKSLYWLHHQPEATPYHISTLMTLKEMAVRKRYSLLKQQRIISFLNK